MSNEMEIMNKQHIYEEEYDNQRVIFDLNSYNKIKKEDFMLVPKRIFKQPILAKAMQLVKREKSELVVIGKREHTIDI